MATNIQKDPFDIDRCEHQLPPDEAAFLRLSEEVFADWNGGEDEFAFRDL
ncbi:MAG: hypothetical protein ACKVRO_18855 [Micropepsaceae bacterium]